MNNLAGCRRWLGKMVKAAEVAQVRRLGRSAVSLVFRTPVLVLEMTGRRSGARRETALAYHRLDDGTLLVVGGAGGQAHVPDWVANLRASPEAVATVDRVPTPVRAVEMTGADREVAWHQLRRVWPQIDRYERRAGRRVPVFRLVPQ